MATWQQKHPGENPSFNYQDELRKSGMTYGQPQRGMMPDYYNQLNQGGAAGAMGGMTYNNAMPTPDQWNSFSRANKDRAIVMMEAQRQGNVPMNKLQQLIDSNAALSNQRSQFSQPYGGSVASSPPSYTTSGNLSGANVWKDKDVLKGWGRGNVAIQANKEKTISDNMRDENAGITVGQFGDYFDAVRETQGGGGGEAWYDDLWKGAKDLGIKGWSEIGIGAMDAYTGWQKTKMAEKQHALAQETFDFQKAAYNKDREGRVLAYNTNAQNVNAWKEAQGRTDLNKLMV